VDRIVDRVGGTPHIGLPRIRSAFAATAGFLLAAEGPADLGAGGADVAVVTPALRAAIASKQLRLAHSAGEDAGGEALRHVVLQPDRLGQIVILHDIENGREGLVLHHGALLGQLDQRRLDIITVGATAYGNPFAASH